MKRNDALLILREISIMSWFFLTFMFCNVSNIVDGAERNYIEEISKLPPDTGNIAEYAKGLSIEDIQQIGRQYGLRAQEKVLKDYQLKDEMTSTVPAEIFPILAPWFEEVANEEDEYKLLIQVLPDKKEPLYWRYTLLAFLKGAQVREWIDVKENGFFTFGHWLSLIDVLHRICLDNDEDEKIRYAACRISSELLMDYHGVSRRMEPDPEKVNNGDFIQRIQDNVSTLYKIIKDTKEYELYDLKEVTGECLRLWYDIGVKCAENGWNSGEIPHPEQIKTEVLQLLTDKGNIDLQNRMLIAMHAYLPDESFIPVLEDLLVEYKETDYKRERIKGALGDIKNKCNLKEVK